MLRALGLEMSSIPPWRASVALYLFPSRAYFVITTVEYFTEGGMLYYSTGFIIALFSHTGPADGGFNIIGFPPVVTGEG